MARGRVRRWRLFYWRRGGWAGPAGLPWPSGRPARPAPHRSPRPAPAGLPTASARSAPRRPAGPAHPPRLATAPNRRAAATNTVLALHRPRLGGRKTSCRAAFSSRPARLENAFGRDAGWVGFHGRCQALPARPVMVRCADVGARCRYRASGSFQRSSCNIRITTPSFDTSPSPATGRKRVPAAQGGWNTWPCKMFFFPSPRPTKPTSPYRAGGVSRLVRCESGRGAGGGGAPRGRARETEGA